MATISTHALNGVDGTHAGGISVTLFCLLDDGYRKPIFGGETDSRGRFSQAVDPKSIDVTKPHELAFSTSAYWLGRAFDDAEQVVASQIAIRLKLRDAKARYHVPLIISPHSFSIWVSLPEASDQ